MSKQAESFRDSKPYEKESLTRYESGLYVSTRSYFRKVASNGKD